MSKLIVRAVCKRFIWNDTIWRSWNIRMPNGKKVEAIRA